MIEWDHPEEAPMTDGETGLTPAVDVSWKDLSRIGEIEAEPGETPSSVFYRRTVAIMDMTVAAAIRQQRAGQANVLRANGFPLVADELGY